MITPPEMDSVVSVRVVPVIPVPLMFPVDEISPTTLRAATGIFVPIPIFPLKYAISTFGSNQNSALVVLKLPMATMSVALAIG